MKRILMTLLLVILTLFTGCSGPSDKELINVTKSISRYPNSIGTVEDELAAISHTSYLVGLYNYKSVLIDGPGVYYYEYDKNITGTKAEIAYYDFLQEYINNDGKFAPKSLTYIYKIYEELFKDPNVNPITLKDSKEYRPFTYKVEKYKLTKYDEMDPWFEEECKFYTIIADNPDLTAKLLIKVYSDNRVYLGFDHSTVMLKKIPNVDPLLNMASNEYGQYLATGIMVDSARITIQAARESGKEWYEIPYDYDDEDGIVNLNNMDPYTGI